jgi:hypothetical protein
MSLISRVRRVDPRESQEAAEVSKLMRRLDSRVLYKPAFEKVLHTEDKFVSRILTKRKVRESLQDEIASDAGVPVEDVIVDVPTLPSVPYSLDTLNPMEIPIFEMVDRKKVSHNLSEYSNIADMMKVYLDVIRVYTMDEYRVKVGQAARNIFQEVPATALIHM